MTKGTDKTYIGVRIPKALAQEAGLSEKMPVSISIEDGNIVICPKKYSLELLLSEITLENMHQEVGIGVPVGREI